MFAVITYLAFHVLLGTLVCFWGSKLYFPVIMGISFLASVLFFLHTIGMNFTGAVIGIIAGFVLAFLVRYIYKAGFFLFGAIAGLVVGMILLAFLPALSEPVRWTILLMVTMIVGICATVWCDVFIVLSTALSGASLLATTLCFIALNISSLSQYVLADSETATVLQLNNYINNEFASENNILLFAVTAVFFVLGIWYQNKANRKAG